MNEDFRDILRALLDTQAQFLVVEAYADVAALETGSVRKKDRPKR